MTWLYIPNPSATSLTHAQELQCSESELNSRLAAMYEPHVTLSGKPTRRALSWPGWKKRTWIKRLSGMTLCIQQRQPEGPIREIGRRTRDRCEGMADTGSNGRRQSPQAISRRETILANQSQAMGHSDHRLPDNENQRICPRGHAIDDAGGSIPLFAPGPGELQKWESLLQIDPTLEPAIRGNPYGDAPGLDACRLRLTGNGVVPLAAAYAFLTLHAALTNPRSI